MPDRLLMKELFEQIANPHRILLMTRVSFWKIAIYVGLWSLVAGILITLRLIGMELPQWNRVIQSELGNLATALPDNLIMSWDGHDFSCQVEVNKSCQDLKLASPKSWQVVLSSPDKIFNFSYLDQPEASTSALITLNPTSVFINLKNGSQYGPEPLNTYLDTKPFTINKPWLIDQAKVINQNQDAYLKTFSAILLVVLPITILIWNFITALKQTLLLFLMLRLFEWHKIKFKRLLKLMLAIVILASLINATAIVIYGPLGFSLFNIAFWVITMFILMVYRRTLPGMLTF